MRPGRRSGAARWKLKLAGRRCQRAGWGGVNIGALGVKTPVHTCVGAGLWVQLRFIVSCTGMVLFHHVTKFLPLYVWWLALSAETGTSAQFRSTCLFLSSFYEKVNNRAIIFKHFRRLNKPYSDIECNLYDHHNRFTPSFKWQKLAHLLI